MTQRRRKAAITIPEKVGPAGSPPLPPLSIGITDLWFELADIAAQSRENNDAALDAYREQAHRSLSAVVGWMLQHPLLGEPELIEPLHLLSASLSSPSGARHPIIFPKEAAKKRHGRPNKAENYQRLLVRRVLAAIIVQKQNGDSVDVAAQWVSDELVERGIRLPAATISEWFGKYPAVQKGARRDAECALNMCGGDRGKAMSLILRSRLLEVLNM